MEKHNISSQPRLITGRKVKKLRSGGMVPGNVYGKKIKSANIQLEVKPFLKLYSRIGESTLAYLQVSGEKEDRPVFVKDLMRDPVTGNLLHVTFRQVDLKEKVTAPVPIKLQGESPAEKEKLGILVQQLDELEVEALPADMPDHFSVDVTGLSEVGSHFTVSDLKLDASKLTVKTEPGTIIVHIEALAKEEVAPVVEAAAVPETIPAAEGESAVAAAPAVASAKPEPKPKTKEVK